MVHLEHQPDVIRVVKVDGVVISVGGESNEQDILKCKERLLQEYDLQKRTIKPTDNNHPK